MSGIENGLPELLTPKEVAHRFRVHASTVLRWIYHGKLDACRTPGGDYRIRREDVESFTKPASKS